MPWMVGFRRPRFRQKSARGAVFASTKFRRRAGAQCLPRRPRRGPQSSGSGLPFVSGAQINATRPSKKMNERIVAAVRKGSAAPRSIKW